MLEKYFSDKEHPYVFEVVNDKIWMSLNKELNIERLRFIVSEIYFLQTPLTWSISEEKIRKSGKKIIDVDREKCQT